MHRDHKLGLALGVLVVGFAAALCFPKQTGIEQRLLQLDNTAELDADIAQLPVHAYTNADLPSAPPPTAAPVAEPATEFGPVASVPGNGEFDLLAGPPAPITPFAAQATDTTANELDHESPIVATPGFSEGEHSGAVAGAPPTDGRHCIVQPGDTLSNLAARYLGNQSRYIELFDANREILATPDDLKPGMVLIIPGMVAGDEPAVPDGGRWTREPRVVIPEVAAEPASGDVPAAADVAPTSGERPRLFRPVRSQSFLKTQPVSRGTDAPLPTMDASANARAAGEPPGDAAETYTVRRGDTLEAIAVRAYGDARRVDDILKANRDTVRDPRRLRPGMKLMLPPEG